MRLVHVIPALGQGGAERLLAELIRHTAHRVTHRIITLTAEPPFFDFGPAEIISLGLKRGEVSAAALRQARAAARAFAPDLLHAWLYHGNLAGSLMALRGTPLIWSIHNTTLPRAGTKPLTRLIARLGGPLSRLSPDCIIYCSDSARAWHEERLRYAPKHGRVIRNGVDFAAFAFDPAARARLRAEWGLREDQVAIGTIGRFDPQKDHVTLAAALARLDSRTTTWVLAGAGCDAQDPALRAMLVRSGMAPRTLPLGRHTDMRALLSALDLLVIGSAFGEALPVVALEAVANDLPVVATRVGSVEDLVIDPALLARPRDPQDLVRAITAAWPLLRQGRPNQATARKRAALTQDHSMAATAARYHQLYQEIGRAAAIAAAPAPAHAGRSACDADILPLIEDRIGYRLLASQAGRDMATMNTRPQRPVR